MKVNPKFLKNNKTFTFVSVSTMHEGFTDVYYKNSRIAIINGVSSPLQWVAKNGSNIPIKVIERLEKFVSKCIQKSANSELRNI